MLTEIQRIFMGDQDFLFLLEVLFRTVIIYFYTLTLMRWIGGRSVSQLSIIEFLLVIAVGSAVGDSLFYPDVPLIPAMTAIFLVVLLNKAVDIAIMRSETLSLFFQGRPQIVVTNGRIHEQRLRSEGLSVPELYLKLRDKGVADIAEVRFAVLEPNGILSVMTHEHADKAQGLDLFQPPAIPPQKPDAAPAPT